MFENSALTTYLEQPARQIARDEQAAIIACGLSCLEHRMRTTAHNGAVVSMDMIHYLRLALGGEPHEQSAILFLDNNSRLLAFEKLFQGSIRQSTIYPRVIAARVLAHGAVNVIMAHNHPSQDVQPSFEDKQLTKTCQKFLKTIDVTLVDHLIVTARGYFSFDEQGLLD